MYIYTNIVEPILVGGVRVPLLRAIWPESNKYVYGDNVSVKLDNPMYLPVASSSINNVEVNIRCDAGYFIEFPYGTTTSLTLHFRKHA